MSMISGAPSLLATLCQICLYSALCTFAFYPIPLNSQDTTNIENSPILPFRNFSIGLSTGSHAIIGADVTTRINDRFNARIGYAHLQFSVDAYRLNAEDLGFSNQTLLIDSDLSLSTFGIFGEFMPTTNRKIRIVGGIVSGLNDGISVNVRFRDNIQLNDYTVSTEQIGYLDAYYSTRSSIYPYLGAGYGRSISAKKIAVNFDLGVYFRGKPQIKVASAGLLSNNEHIGPILEDGLKTWQWHPNVGLRISYRLDMNKSVKVSGEDEFYVKENEEEKSIASVKSVTKEEQPATDSIRTPKPIAAPIVDNSNAPYLTFQGTAIDIGSTDPLDYIFIHVYKVVPGVPNELVRTGRFLNGEFRIALQQGYNYVFNLEHHLYEKLKEEININVDVSEPVISKNFQLKPVEPKTKKGKRQH